MDNYPAFLAAPGAACSPRTADLFMRTEDRRGTKIARIRTAKLVCSICPFQRECLAWGKDHGESGVWGGLELAEGREVHRGRRALV